MRERLRVGSLRVRSLAGLWVVMAAAAAALFGIFLDPEAALLMVACVVLMAGAATVSLYALVVVTRSVRAEGQQHQHEVAARELGDLESRLDQLAEHVAVLRAAQQSVRTPADAAATQSEVPPTPTNGGVKRADVERVKQRTIELAEHVGALRRRVDEASAHPHIRRNPTAADTCRTSGPF